jgi:adenylate cyclase
MLAQHRVARALTVGLLAALLAVTMQGLGWLERLELSSYDARLRATSTGGRSDLIELVDYDEVTLEAYSDRWGRLSSWPRPVHQRVLNYIARGKPRVVVFDMLFLEGDPGEGEDREFVDEVRKQGNVVLAALLMEDVDPRVARFYEAVREASGKGAGKKIEDYSLGPAQGAGVLQFKAMGAFKWPFNGLWDAAAALGSAHLETDRDAVSRGVSPAAVFAGRLWPTLSTAAGLRYLGAPSPQFKPGVMRLGGRSFSLDREGRRLIRWYGPGRDRYRSAIAGVIIKSVEDGKELIPPERFRDKIVIVGSSAAGAHDLRHTPFGLEPGMMIHAAAIESLVRGDSVARGGTGLTVLFCLVLSLAVALSFLGKARHSALRGSGAYVLLAGGYAAGAFGLYARGGIWMDLVAPEVAAGLSLAGALLTGYLVEGRQSRILRRGLARFLSPEVLAAVSPSLDDLRPGMGRRCEVSMMFCDVRGFTPMSEKLEPEQVVEILGVYLGAMTDVIMAHGGTLSKYLGDGIMAFWGAPQAVPDHAARAARAALAMVRAQEKVKSQLAAAGRQTFEIGIGLHSGPAVVGTVGSEQRLEYTAIGDTVNLASRVESLTKDFGVRVVVTSDFAGRLAGEFGLRELGSVKVKGRSADVKVLELTRTAEAPEEEGSK